MANVKLDFLKLEFHIPLNCIELNFGEIEFYFEFDFEKIFLFYFIFLRGKNQVGYLTIVFVKNMCNIKFFFFFLEY